MGLLTLLCDYSMSGMDGVEVIERARALLPGLPCLLLTGYAGERATLSAQGSFVIVGKPVTVEALAAHIEASLRGEIV